jgi:hypothetical protein
MMHSDDTIIDPERRWQEFRDAGEEAGRYQRVLEAEEYYLDALQVAKGFGPQDSRLAETLVLLGRLNAHSPLGPPGWEAAERHLERVLALREQALGPDHREVALVLVLLAGGAAGRGFQNGGAQVARAASLLERSLAIQERTGESERSLTAETSNTLLHVTAALRRQGMAREAEALHRRFIALGEKIHGPDCGWVAFAAANLSSFYLGQGRHEVPYPGISFRHPSGVGVYLPTRSGGPGPPAHLRCPSGA